MGRRKLYIKFSTRLVAILLFAVMGLVANTKSGAEGVQPGYDDYPIALSSISGMADDTIYTTSYWSGRIGVDGSKLGNPIPPGAYAVITVDSTYLESFTVPAAEIVSGSRLDKTSEPGVWKMYVSLHELNSATKATFLYNLKFKNRVTPEGYTVTPQVDLYIPAGTTDLTDDIHIGTSVGDPTMQPTATIKTNKPLLNKHIISNDSEMVFAANGRHVYGGTADAGNTFIETPADVAFQYSMSTTQGRQTVNGEFQGWGDGKNRTRAQSQIIITDTLPTYTKADGSTGTAVFDAAKNPGWTDNGNGTVSYTVNESAPGKGDADAVMTNTVTLLLQFPDAALSTSKVGATTFLTTTEMTNTAEAELHPVNESDYEKDNVVAPIDEIKFKIDTNPAKLYDGIGSQFIKNTNMAGRISVDPGSMDQYDATFSMTVTNINPQPMTNIVLKDGPFDTRHYLKRLYGGSAELMNNIDTIYGVKADGTKVPINNLINATNTGFNSNTIIDREVYDEIAGYVAQVKAGTLSETDVPKVDAVYTSLEIVLKEEYALDPGESFSFLIGLGYTDPYHLTVTGNQTADTLTNEGTLTGMLGDAEFTGTRASSNRLFAIKESFGISKTTMQNYTGTIDEILRFQISFTNGLGKARQFNNAQIIDVLPQGVTFASTYPVIPQDKITIVDNFMGSGKQAVIVDIGTVLASDMPSKNFSIYGKINENATPSSFPGANEQNTNHVYLKADNWKSIPSGVAIDTVLPDIHNLNGNGEEANIIGAKSTFTALLPTDVTGVKYVRAGTEGEWSLQPVYVNYDSPYQFKLTIRNNESEALTETTIYDILPFAGDTYYNYDGEEYPSRNSAFSGLMTGPVIAPEGFTVMYRTDSYMPPNPDAGINDSQAWKTEDQITDWSRVRGFKISSNEGTTIAPYSTTDFIVNMKTRTYVLENNLNNQTSNNSFAIRYDEGSFGQSNVVSLHLTQAFPVKKVWNGGPEPREEVYVQLVRDGVDVPDRILPLNEANEWEASFGNLPVYSPYGKQYEYTVREVNTPVNYTASVAGNQLDGYTITNTYVSPQLLITGTKIWDGGPPVDDYQVALQLYRWIGDGDYTNGPDGATDPKDEFDADGLIPKEAVGNVHYVNEANSWSSSKNNPIYNQDGEEYQYVVREVKTPFTRWDHPEYYEQIINETTDHRGNLIYGEKQYHDDGTISGWSFDITNKYNSPLEDILTSKVWVGGDYSYPRILIDLYRYKEGQDPSDAEVIVDGVSSATTNVSPYHIYKDMPTTDREDGVPYVYRIEEVDLRTLTPEEMAARNITQEDVDEFSNYVSMRNFAQDPLGVDDPNLSLINEYVSPRLIVEGSKTWEGGDAANRPEVSLQLMQDGKKFEAKPTLTGTGVPGSLISINIGTEANYTTMVHPDGRWYLEFQVPVTNETTFTVYQVETGKGPSKKIVWQNGEISTVDAPTPTPSEVPVITALETQANPITVSGNETVSWNVPRTDSFEQNHNYQIIEVDVPDNYTDSYPAPVEERDEKGNVTKLSQEVINTFSPDTIEITANKEWQGGPEEKPGFEFQLYRITGNDETTKTAVGVPEALLTENFYKWNVPDRDADGNLYTYFVEEVTAPLNYTASYKLVDGVEDRLTIVNTFTPDPITVPVQKTWMGGSLEDRPAEITAGLYIGDVLAKDENGDDLTITLNADNQWRGEFANVPVIDDSLNPIEYNVRETLPEGSPFAVSYEGDQIRGYRIINTYTPETFDVTATKNWVGGEDTVGAVTRPPVELQLMRNLVPVGDPVWVDGRTDENETTPWNYTWKDLPVQDLTGTDYIYTIQEVNVPDNFVADHNGLTVTNTYQPAQTEFTVTKVWEDGPLDHPAAVFQLYRSLATNPDEKEAVDDLIYVTGTEHTWTNLPTTNEAGVAYSYWVEETNIPENYTSVRSAVVGNRQTITNTFNAPKGSITGTKTWIGGPAIKPEITLILERQIGTGAKEVVAEQVLQNGDLDAVWNDVDLTDPNGNEYIFTVREKEIPANYTASYNGLNVTNTYAIPKNGVVEATKIWEGGPAVNRPEVHFDLYRHVSTGEPERVPGTTNKAIATPDGETEAKVSWENLETKDTNGNDYIFTVKEVGTPSGYTKSENGLTVTNTFVQQKTAFTVTKVWEGGPADKPVIGMQLRQRLETETEDQAISYGAAVALTDELSYKWTDLPKTDMNGVPYIYSADETSVPRGYKKDVGEVTYNFLGEGRQTITNTMDTRDLNFTKTWVGGPDVKPNAVIGVRVNGEQITDINGRVVSDITLRNGESSGSFTNLPYFDADGNEINYLLVEVSVDGIPVENGKSGKYDVVVRGTNITNTFIQDKTTIHAEKEWNGGSTEAHIPVTLQLFREAAGQNKEFVGEAVTVDGDTDWKVQWTDQDAETTKGDVYTYTVEEVNVPAYFTPNVEGTGTADDPFIVTNNYNPDQTDITAFKKWIGGPIDKPAVELELYRRTAEMDQPEIVPAGLPLIGLQNPITLQNGEISYTWKNLPTADDNGNEYIYSVQETKIGTEEVVENAAGDYIVSYDGMVVTNSYKSEDSTVQAEKVWIGGPEESHTAPEMILYQNGEVYDAVPVVTPAEGTADRFAYEWTVPKTDPFGQDYSYTVDEAQIPEGYGKSVAVAADGKTVITNTFEAEITDISVHKDWVGGSDYPEITFELQRRVGTGEFEKVAEEILPVGDHIHIWNDMPLTNDADEAYEYRVVETKIGDTTVVDNKALTYTVSYSGNVQEGFTVTNTSENSMEIPVEKVWVDNENAGNTRPAQITFTAVREDGKRKTQVFEVTDENIYTITGLEKFKPNSTEEYRYTIEEAAMPNYEAAVDGYQVTNTLTGVTEISVRKIWEGVENPDDYTATFQLYANDELVEGKVIEITGNNSQPFTDLDTFDEDGVQITYTVREIEIPGEFESRMTEQGDCGCDFVFTNTKPVELGKGIVSFTKVDGETEVPLSGAQFQLQPLGQIGEVKTATSNAEGLVEFADVPEGNYLLKETVPPEGYILNVSSSLVTIDRNGNVMINGKTQADFRVENIAVPVTPEPEPEKIEIKGEKIWIGEADSRPTIELQLFQDGKKLGDPVELKNGTTDYTWKDLPRADEDGKVYQYTVDEVAVPEGYEKIPYTGTVVINKLIEDPVDEPVIQDEKTEFRGRKIWVGPEETRPTIELQLKQNGADYLEPVELKNGSVEAVWANLPMRDAGGNPYNYTVDEVEVPKGYTKEVIHGSVVVNTKEAPPEEPETETISFTGTKAWAGGPAVKPDIQLVLLQNGTRIGDPVTLKNGQLSATWENLPTRDGNGDLYKYSVDEVNVPEGYEKYLYLSVPNAVFNVYKGETTPEPKPETISVTGTKIWKDGPAAKPDIQLQLLQNGTKVGAPIVLKNGTLSTTWKDLPKTDAAGKDYIYTVDEVNVPAGYEKVLTGRTVVNIYKTTTPTPTDPTNPTDPKPGDNTKTVEYTATKIWKGGPEEKPAIELQLMRNGEKFGEPITLDGKTEYKWTGLPKGDASGKDYVYTVDEVNAPKDYTKTVQGSTITNTHKDYVDEEFIDFTMTKKWVGGPENKPVIKIQLKQNGKNYGDPVELKDIEEYKWTDLPKKDSEGKDYIYTVDEVDVPSGYTKTVSGSTITNTYGNTPLKNIGSGTGGTGYSGGSRITSSNNYVSSPVRSTGTTGSSYYTRSAEIPKTNDPTVIWGILSVSALGLLGVTTYRIKKLKDDEESEK